ncbi:MAG: hypothetical protein IKH02_06725 [Prevotella sp.]|nr:hypothetical protein [Prevotella sp.]
MKTQNQKTGRNLFLARTATLLFAVLLAHLLSWAQSSVSTITTTENITKTTTVYAGEVVVDGVTMIKYLYSDDMSRKEEVINNLLNGLQGMTDDSYATLLDGLEADAEASGLALCSDAELVAAMDENWSSAKVVGMQYFSDKTVASETNSNLYDIDEGFKAALDAQAAARAENIETLADVEKCIVTHLDSRTVTDVWYNIVDGNRIRHYDTTVIYDSESTTVIFTKVELESSTDTSKPFVDLGLTSGTLWATCNIGADNPQDAGLFFAWGDTVGHGSDPSDGYFFSWDNYKWCVVVDYFSHFTKYCTESSSGNDGFADGKYELDPEDDAAYINWGSEWRTPSKEQFDELKNECTWTLKTIGDVKGYEVVGQNGNSIFLPETGWRIDDMLLDGGAYWARSANPEDTGGAYYLGWDDWGEYEYGGRVNGQCVRPVINPYKYIQLVDDAVNSDAIATAASSDDTYEVKLDGRTLFKDGEWNTLCLPFNLTAEQLSASPLAGADILTLTSASVTGHHVDLTFGSNESSLTAGTPYIVRWEADTKIPTIIDPVFRGVTLSDEKHDFVSADGHVNFIGYYDAFTILPSDDPLVYYLTTGNILKFTTKERLLKACRTYFTFTPSDGSSANDFTFDISFGGDPNSIHTAITENDKTAGVWFDLSGRRLNGKPSQKGIYVTDGQKVVIQ